MPSFGPSELLLLAEFRWLQRARLIRELESEFGNKLNYQQPYVWEPAIPLPMQTKLILMCLAGGLTMAPLLKAEPPVVVIPGSTTTTTVTTGVWRTVPEEYDGDYYTYNNQYYYGGKRETGDFESEGRHYTDRYQHEGKWIYGGKWEHHERKHADRDK
jgi:hypothetical protein